MIVRPTLVCLRKARVTIPQLSPTHTRAKITKFCLPHLQLAVANNTKEGRGKDDKSHYYLECYDPLFVVTCTPDLVTSGYRFYEDHCPQMIVESHEEGVFCLNEDVVLDQWYDVGHTIGTIDDGDDDGDENEEWIWQAYAYDDDEEEEDTAAGAGAADTTQEGASTEKEK